MILVLCLFISIFSFNSRSFLAREDYIIDKNQSIDKDFIVDKPVKITGGAIVTFSNCHVKFMGIFRIENDSKVLFENCRIEGSQYPYLDIDNAQLTLNNCITHINNINSNKGANILIKNTTIKCSGEGIPAGITFRPENKIIIENSNVDSLSIYMSNITIENLTQGFISNYKLEGNNSELIISDSTINYIDLWNESGVNKINNVSCRSIMLNNITNEEKNTIEISNSKAEGLNTTFIGGTYNIDNMKQGYNTEAEASSENGKFHLKIVESEISGWGLQVYGRSSENPTIVNIKGSVITFLNPDKNSVVNFEQSQNPNRIVSKLET